MRTRWISLALAVLSWTARAESNICSWATFTTPTSDNGVVPLAAWTVAPPCVSTGAFYRAAEMAISLTGTNVATNVQVEITVDDRLVMVDADLSTAAGYVQYADAPAAPVVVHLATLAPGASVSVVLRVRAASWTPHGETPRIDWRWGDGAWPACDKAGGREIIPGVLLKQIWARDLYWALEERCEAVHSNGSAYVWGLATPGRPSWWSEAGVTNRVVRYTAASQDQDDRQQPTSTFLEAAKVLAARLAPYYLDTQKVDPDDFETNWHAFQQANGGRTDQSTQTNDFTGWVWECPGAAHSYTYVGTEQDRLGTNLHVWTETTLPEALGLPRGLFRITPYRWPEGPCSYSGQTQWIFRDSAVTGVCNWASVGAPTAEDGPAPTATWVAGYVPGCVSNGQTAVTVRLKVRNGGSTTATNVAVEVTIDDELELVQAGWVNATSGTVQWAAAPALPVRGLLRELAAGDEELLDITVRSRRAQGPSSSRTWYWPEFGWDSLREAIQEMKVMRVSRTSAGDGGAPTSSGYPVEAAWRWDVDEDGDNWSFGNAESTRTYLFEGTPPGTVVASGDYSTAKDLVEADVLTFGSATQHPYHSYEAVFYGQPEPMATNTYVCAWTLDFDSRRSQAWIDVRRQWPPTNVTLTATFAVDVESWTAPTGQQTWSTEVLASHVFSAPGTNDVDLAATRGDADLNPDYYPPDPSGQRGLPVLGEGEYPDDSPEGLAERRANRMFNYKSWEQAFLFLEYEWSLP